MQGLTPREYASLRSARGVKVGGVYGNETLFISPNFASPAWSNPLLRRALAFGIDYNQVIQTGYLGQARKWNGVIPTAFPNAIQPEPRSSYNPDEAKRLLAEAGFPDGAGLDKFPNDLKLTYAAEREATLGPVATVIQTSLRNVGIPVVLDPISQTQMADRRMVRNDLPLALSDIDKSAVIDPVYATLLSFVTHAKGGIINVNNYSNAEVDRLYNDATGTGSADIRAKDVIAVQEMVYASWRWFRSRRPGRSRHLREAQGPDLVSRQHRALVKSLARKVAGGGKAWAGADLRFVARRLGVAMFQLVGLVLVIFFSIRLLPADPVSRLVGTNASPEAYQSSKHALGLDRPVMMQLADYSLYRYGLMQGDLGNSWSTGDPVLTNIRNVLPVTLELITHQLRPRLPDLGAARMLCATAPEASADRSPSPYSLFAGSQPEFWWGCCSSTSSSPCSAGRRRPSAGSIRCRRRRPPSPGFITVDSLLAGHMAAFRDGLHHLMLPVRHQGVRALRADHQDGAPEHGARAGRRLHALCARAAACRRGGSRWCAEERAGSGADAARRAVWLYPGRRGADRDRVLAGRHRPIRGPLGAGTSTIRPFRRWCWSSRPSRCSSISRLT